MAKLILRWFDEIFESDFSNPERYAADASRGVEYAGARPAAESSPPPSLDDAPTSPSSPPAMGDQLGEDSARVDARADFAINAMSKGI